MVILLATALYFVLSVFPKKLRFVSLKMLYML